MPMCEKFKEGVKRIDLNTLLGLCDEMDDGIAIVKIQLVDEEGKSLYRHSQDDDVVAYRGTLNYLWSVDNEYTALLRSLPVYKYYTPTSSEAPFVIDCILGPAEGAV